MIRRAIAALLGGLSVLNGGLMLVDGAGWYGLVPGVGDTGPLNPHFVADIGAAFLIAGLSLLARAWQGRFWPAGVTGAGFLAAHGLIHLAGLIQGASQNPIFELFTVVLPAGLALWAALPEKGKNHA